MRTSPSRRSRISTTLIATLMSGFLVASVTLIKTSAAGFSDTTNNATNSWATGSVNLVDDDSGSAMFSVSGLNGGDSLSRCIRVTYNGTILTGGSNTVNVKLYASATGGAGDAITTSGDLRPYLDIQVQRGSAGTFSATCAGFTPEAGPIQTTTTTLTNFVDPAQYVDSSNGGFDNYAHGALTWAPSSSTDFRVYKVTATVKNQNQAQFRNATATLTWEAQSAGSNSTPATGANSM